MSDVILTLHNITKTIGAKTIIELANFGIHQMDKIGLIGINGSGKTTLLKLLAGEIDANSGSITHRSDLKIAFLPQNPVMDPESSVIQHVIPSGFEPTSEDSYRYKAVLSQLGMTEFDKPIKYLSGGQKRKTDIARVLSIDADLLVLDEPTNHLDLDTIEWLQEYLCNVKKAVIFVTHDRYFLDAISSKIIDIEAGKLYLYVGNYSQYVKGKIQREIDIERKDTRRKAQLKKELDWLSRGAKARSSKPKNHIERVKELLSKSYLISNAELEISFQTDRLGKSILELYRLSKSYDGVELFRDIEHHFQAKERIGVIGANGCGKTTLLKLIIGEEEPDLGTIKVGVNTHFSYYKQEDESFNPKLSVYDYIAQYAEVIKTRDGTKLTASEMLQRFLFDGKMQQMKLESLSGGERKRLYLLKSLMFGANFIILDEPTNDLDIKTLEILEDYLDAFHGCLLVVSHDRYFLDRTIDYLFIFENGKLRKFAGNYSDYLLIKRYEKEVEEDNYKAVVIRPKREKKGLSYNEQQELIRVEREIGELENKINELDSILHQPPSDFTHEDYSNLDSNYQAFKGRHEALFIRWMELNETDSN